VQAVRKSALQGQAEGPEEANTWSCTELFPSACARVGAGLPSRSGYLAGREAPESLGGVAKGVSAGGVGRDVVSVTELPCSFRFSYVAKFYDLVEAQQSPIAAEVVRRIGELYAIEREIRDSLSQLSRKSDVAGQSVTRSH
jgi:hypothetical protein